MKYIAFIGGPVLLAAICAVVLWANMPTAKLKVCAVVPLGTTFGNRPDQPLQLWDAAVSNAGRAPARWLGYLHFKQGDHEWAEYAALAAGRVSAGGSETFRIAVPQNSPTNWAVTVKYYPEMSRVEKTLFSWFDSVPKLRRMLPNSGEHFAADVWHSGTNVTTAH